MPVSAFFDEYWMTMNQVIFYCKLFFTQMVKRLPTMWETWVWSLSQEDPLEKEMATDSLILAWEIPWTKEPGGLQSMGSQGVRHDQVINIHIPWKKKKINNYTYNSLIRQKGPESITMSFILIFFNGIFLLHISNIFVLIQVA